MHAWGILRSFFYKRTSLESLRACLAFLREAWEGTSTLKKDFHCWWNVWVCNPKLLHVEGGCSGMSFRRRRDFFLWKMISHEGGGISESANCRWIKLSMIRSRNCQKYKNRKIRNNTLQSFSIRQLSILDAEAIGYCLALHQVLLFWVLLIL